MIRPRRALLALPFALLPWAPVTLRAGEWPQWRGPNRDGSLAETGLLRSFPADGLQVRWRVPAGWGFSSPVVSQGRVYLVDSVLVKPRATERIRCFEEATGKVLWAHEYEVAYEEWAFDPAQEIGPVATPIVEDGNVYAVGRLGHLFCLDGGEGNVRWQKNLESDYQFQAAPGSPSPLIHEELLILFLGGKPDACLVALDKKTGQEVWRALDESLTFSSPIVIDSGGKNQLIVWTKESVTSLDPQSGKTWWRKRLLTNRDYVVSTPVFQGDRLLIGGLMLKLAPDKPAAEILWPRSKAPSRRVLSHTSTALLEADHVYSAKSSGEMVCLQADTGEPVWEANEVTGMGNGASIHLTPNGDSVLLFTDRGELIRTQLTAQGYREISRTQLLEPTFPFGGRKVVWTPPAYANRHVFARNGRELICASLAADEKEEQTMSPFTDCTADSGVADALTRHYEKHPKWWLSGLNLVDLDSDGNLDLFLAAHGAGRSLALLGNGRGTFLAAEGIYPPSEIHLPHDINEDGKLDLQMTWQDGGGKWWINHSSPGRLEFKETETTADQARVSAMIDLNRDGKVDWLHERPGIVFEFGDGKGGFQKAGNLQIAPTRNEINVHPADLNGDGRIDLAVQWGRYDFEKGRSRLYFSDGPMTFRDATTDAGLFEEGCVIKGIGDVNHDGHLDLLVLEQKKPEIYLNDGRGNYSKLPDAITGMEDASQPRYVSWGLAVVTDFDNDGLADLLWNGRHFLWTLRGTGGGRFEYRNKKWRIEDKSAASVDDGHCFGDVDRDGDLDIIGYTGSIDSKRWVRVYRNDLPRKNWIRIRPVGGPGNRAAAGAKIRITDPGQPENLLWFEQVMILNSQSAHSYYNHAQTERHFGLGDHRLVDVTVEFYPSGRRVEKNAVPANSTIEVAEIE